MTTQPAQPRPWFRVEARAAATETEETTTSAEVYIYDEIGESWWGGIAPKALIDEINALDVDVLHVLINSPGGAAWDGVAIMNALRRHPARVEVTVDGLAASAASVIAMAGDHITMNRGSELMIHDAWGYAMGNAQDMQQTADVLHKLSDSLADIYAARAGGDRAAWRAEMQAETWYTAEEAVTAGLADTWADQPAAQASFDRSKFSARASARRPRVEPPDLPSSSEPGEPNRKELPVSDILQAGLRNRLGVTDAEASDETLLAALDQALTAEPATVTVPEGVVQIDAAVLEDLRAQAALGAQARAEQDRVRRDGIIQNALNEGRISPASQGDWREQLEANEEATAKLLGTLAKNTIPVGELGHSDSVNDADEALYARVNGNAQKGA